MHKHFAQSASFALPLLAVAILFTTAPARADVSGLSGLGPATTNGASESAQGLDADRRILTLTDGGRQEATSAFAPTPQPIRAFTASFTYRASEFGGPGAPGGGDGFAFVIQNDPRGVKALGGTGNSFGYGGDAPIRRSVAVRFGIFGGSSEDVAVNGTPESAGDVAPVDLRGGHPVQITLAYDGGALTETLHDLTTGDTFTETHALNIPAAVGGDIALVGLTGASGDATARQIITLFTFHARPPVPLSQRKHIAVKPPKTFTNHASYVDPFIGTTAGGNTYPGAVVPFGMVQFSPDTRAGGIGYEYGDRSIEGFSLTHMSGVGCDDYGDVFLTATTGPVKTAIADYASPFSHRHESASPGYYGVTLTRSGVVVDLTATTHAGVARFTFPAGQAANILVPISHTLTYTKGAEVRVVGDREIVGQVASRSFCGANQFYTVYFVMKLDQPFQSFGTFAGPTRTDGSRSVAQAEKQPAVGAYVGYPAAAHRVVTARIGISFVDSAGARANLEREVGTRGFDDIRNRAAADWESELKVADVTGGTNDQRSVFYTALYHCLLMPNIFSDVDGRYLGFDGKVHRAEAGHAVYANYSGWDIYRNEASLLALLEPARMQDMCQSIVLMYAQGGWIDRWPQANTYTNVMCGSPLTSFMATAWNYGLHGFDMKTAYEGMLKDATRPAPLNRPYAGESNVVLLDKLGYIPDDKEGYGSVSQTEEDCYAYSALALVSESLGKSGDATLLRKRALYYRNLFDPETKFLRPRLADGTWYGPFDPTQEHGFVEGTGWHYRWLAPHDVAGLITLFGGDTDFNDALDRFFAYPKPTWSGQFYNPYNETDLQAPFLYDYSGAPYKTQVLVRKLLAEVYKTTPDGIPGNDDCGTMSAWAVFSMLGFYPTDPVRPAFELCSPVFPKAVLHLSAPYAAGKTFTVSAPASDNVYIQSVSLGHEAHNRPWIAQSAISQGGTLTVHLGPTLNTLWGATPAARPPSLGK